MAQGEGKIATPTALRLILSSMAEMHEKISCIDRSVAADMADRDRLTHVTSSLVEQVQEANTELSQVREDVKRLTATVDAIRKDLDDAKQAAASVQKNMVVKVGDLITAHPKAAGVIFVLVLILSNLWLMDGFRRAVLTLLGVPQGLIDLLNPIS